MPQMPTALSYQSIANMPTELGALDASVRLAEGCKGFHESLFRSYHVAAKVRSLLEQGTSTAVVLELMDLMEGKGE